MSRGLSPGAKVLAPAALLSVALAAAGCARKPQPLTDPAVQSKHVGSQTLEPKEGLTFYYHGAGDGANTDGATPSTSWTEFNVSDGSEVRAYEHSFKRPESAQKFYSDRVGGAGAVLQEEERAGGQGFVAGRRAVIEFAPRGSPTRGAILELRGSSVSEVIGATVGHALAFERWQERERQ